MTVEERMSKIIRLAELARKADDPRQYRQYMQQINLLSAMI